MAAVILPDGRVVPGRELRWSFARSSGPGGQSVNTADSAVRLSWDVLASDLLSGAERARLQARLAQRLRDGSLTVRAHEHRSQHANRKAAADRMSAMLATALAPPPQQRRPTRPSRASRSRRVEAKRRRSAVKQLRQPPRADG